MWRFTSLRDFTWLDSPTDSWPPVRSFTVTSKKTKIYESAVKLQEKALESAEGIEYKEARERGIAQASFELGMCHLFMEKDEALAHFDKCLEHTDDETLIENCNFHKILYYRSKDDMDNSLEMYNKLKHNKNAMLLSSIYMNAKNYDKALEIIEEDLKEKESAEKKEVQDQFILFQLYQHLAHVRLVKKNISEALTAANAAETILNAELKDVGVDPAHLEKQQDIFKAIYVEQQQYAKVLSFCIHNLANPQLQEKVSQQQIEEILPQFAVQSKKSLLFLTETMEPESPAFYIFLMTPTGKLYFARSTTSISIEGYAQKAVQSLQDESKSKKAKKEADKVLEEMYKHFITPIKEHIPEDAPLAIVTHLFQIHALSIPFAALKNPETGKHLAEEYCVELTPLQFIEQIEKIQETKEKPAPAVTKPEKPQLVVVAAEKTSAEIQRFQKIVKNKKLDCEMNVLAKPKKKAVLKELKSAPGLMYFMTGDNLENDQKEAPTQFGLQLNRSELLIPKDDLKKNYAPDTTMPDACLFGHVSGAFAFCQYAHYFLQSGANHVVGFKLVVREKLDDKILLNEEIYPRFFQAYVKNGQDASKAYREVMQHLIANHDRMTWSSFAMVSRVTPLPKKQ
uniref:CHAT domain-containing protein n=1 Tax=Percolomonas cosmopolitus TaxID=63605 RepID=A0A7S1KT71_9EUKA|mmetsp:Transcript_7416/g.27722  ORF Transcript_7416/g.27722 Transcript_7416/m.27722 type:complete len:625 (+) Transcript_7416:770-2644(+)